MRIFGILVLICIQLRSSAQLSLDAFLHTSLNSRIKHIQNDRLMPGLDDILYKHTLDQSNVHLLDDYKRSAFWRAFADRQESIDSVLNQYIDLLPAGTERQLRLFDLANILFVKKEYKKAIRIYEQIDPSYLTNDQIVEKNFNLAYSKMMLGERSSIVSLFASLKDINGKYFEAGNYYYGLMKYYEGNYAEAYQSFIKIAEHPYYRRVVPFYLCEIQYLDREVGNACYRAEQFILKEPKLFYKPELHMLIGRIYFEQGEYDKTLPHIQEYMSSADHIRREDIFIYGYTHYKLKNYKKAAGILDKISFEEDTLKQMALFTQAECYLQQSKKQEALQMYQQSVDIGLHPQYTEIGKYNYAKLAYELGMDKEALNAAYNFVKQFPRSTYKDDCYKLMTALAEQTENYEKVIELYQKLEQNKITQTSLQRLYYNLGQEYFENKKFNDALEAFKKSQALRMNNEITSMATFWIAESYYQLKKYNSSIAAAKDYLIDPAPSVGDVSDNGAYMLLAYNYLDLNKQDSATYYVNYIKSRNDKKFYERHKYYLDRLYNTVDQLSMITATRDDLLNQYQRQIKLNPSAALKLFDSALTWRNNAPIIQEKINNYKAMALYQNKDTNGAINLINAMQNKKYDEVKFIEAEVDIARADSTKTPTKAIEYVNAKQMDEFKMSILFQLVTFYKKLRQYDRLNEYWQKIESKIFTIPANNELINQFNTYRKTLLEEKIINE